MSTTEPSLPATVAAPMIVVPRAAAGRRFPWPSIVLAAVVVPGGLWWGGVIDPLALLPKTIAPLESVLVDRATSPPRSSRAGPGERQQRHVQGPGRGPGRHGRRHRQGGQRPGRRGRGRDHRRGGQRRLSGSDAAAKLANKVSMGGVSGMKTQTFKKAGGAAKSGQTGSGVAATPSGMSGGAAAGGSSGGVKKPSIKSFSMTVAAHTPLRPATTKAAASRPPPRGPAAAAAAAGWRSTRRRPAPPGS